MATSKKPKAIDGAELISAVQSMRLGPDDALVVRSEQLIRPEFRVYLQKQFAALFPENRVIVIDGPIDLMVLGAEADEGDRHGTDAEPSE